MEGAATGMGLYLSRQVAEALRIRLDVSSVVGEGTLVTLTFARENEMAHLSGM
ncbi:Sensor histidine kinase GraS [compost metagenome]